MISPKDYAEIMSNKEKHETRSGGAKLVHCRVILTGEQYNEWMGYSTSMVSLTLWASCVIWLKLQDDRQIVEHSPASLQVFAPSPAASPPRLLCTGHLSSRWKLYRQDWARRRNPGGLKPRCASAKSWTTPRMNLYHKPLVCASPSLSCSSFFTCVSICFLYKKNLLKMFIKVCPLESCWGVFNRQLQKVVLEAAGHCCPVHMFLCVQQTICCAGVF